MASIFRQQYTIKDKDGRTLKKRSSHWYIDYRAPDGIRKRVRGFKDKVATAQLAARLEKEAELADVGIVDRFREHRKTPLLVHLEAFREALVAGGATRKHADMTYARAKTVVEGCRWAFMADVQASTVLTVLAGLSREVTERIPVTNTGRRKYEKQVRRVPLSIQSRNHYLRRLKAFFNWMVADQRIEENPIAYLKCQNPETDIRKRRRALSPEEMATLLASTERALAYRGISGRERAKLYILATNTGLRASELASLTWGSFDFDTEAPTVGVEAAYSKHRQKDTLPLRQDVAKLFLQWQEERKGSVSDKVFGIPRHIRWAAMLKRDLESAGIEYRDDQGRTVDFHALRHCFITNVVKGGASPKVAQTLARHSKIGLTMDVYTHLELHDQRGALDALPPLPIGADHQEAQKAVLLKTGTDGFAAGAYKPAYKGLTEKAYPSGLDTSSIGAHAPRQDEVTERPGGRNKPFETGVLGQKKNPLSAIIANRGLNEAEGDRTLNLRIDNPML